MNETKGKTLDFFFFFLMNESLYYMINTTKAQKNKLWENTKKKVFNSSNSAESSTIPKVIKDTPLHSHFQLWSVTPSAHCAYFLWLCSGVWFNLSLNLFLSLMVAKWLYESSEVCKSRLLLQLALLNSFCLSSRLICASSDDIGGGFGRPRLPGKSHRLS